MARKRIFILGAGLAGLSAAWHLQKKNIDCVVLEKEPEPGGLCRSKRINGFTFDFSGHLLHCRHPYTSALLKRLMRGNLTGHRRSAWVYSHDTYTAYPFQANLFGLPPSVIKECLSGFFNTFKNKPSRNTKDQNFLEWIHQMFGKGIGRHFMVPYNEKFWTVPPETLTCDWLDGFIPVPTVREVIAGAMEKNKGEFGYNAYFWYPRKGGIASLVRAFERQVRNVRLDHEAVQIDLANKEIEILNKGTERFDYLISTVPLPQLSCLIKDLPARTGRAFEKLRWNSIFNLNLGLENEDFDGRHWVYFPGKETCFFRIGYFHNFSSLSAPKGTQSLYAEVSYSGNRPKEKAVLVKRIKADLKKAGICLKKSRVLAQDVHDITYGYPIYDKNYKAARESIVSFLHNNDIVACGRYGSWRYMSMEDSILDGKSVAEKVGGLQ